MEIQIKNKEPKKDADFLKLTRLKDATGSLEVSNEDPAVLRLASDKFEVIDADTLPGIAKTMITKGIEKKFKKEGFKVSVKLF